MECLSTYIDQKVTTVWTCSLSRLYSSPNNFIFRKSFKYLFSLVFVQYYILNLEISPIQVNIIGYLIISLHYFLMQY